MNQNDYFFNAIFVLLLYFNVFATSDWYIDHNELHYKEVKVNKYFTPISYLKQKQSRINRIELLFPILEIYSHFISVLSVLNIALVKLSCFRIVNKYFYFVSFVIYGLIFVIYHIICKLNK